MDFIEGLPKVGGKSVILSVYSAETIASIFFSEVVRLHGLPSTIVSDRDPVFTSTFWTTLFKLMGTKLHMSSAFHPQSDGQTETINKTIGMYLWCLTGDRPRQWLRWLPWAEYVYNTSFRTALKETPFRIIYGRDPSALREYDLGECRVPAVTQSMTEREEFLSDVRARLEQAQAVAKRAYDRGHRAVSFSLGDWVWLRVRHRSPATLSAVMRGKLRPRYFGPYKVAAMINEVAYRLELPSTARIHNVFHIGLLKKFLGTPDSPPPLPPIHDGAAQLQPAQALKIRQARGLCQILIQWDSLPSSAATWEDLDDFRRQYPHFQLEDELILDGGRDVMWGATYRRRPKDKRPS
jgi:hypothetical protein